MNYKKIKLITLITFITFMFLGINKVIAQSDFRDATWGMKSTTIKSVEKIKLISEDTSSIIFDCQLGDIKGKLLYFFTPTNQLIRAKYYLTPDYLNMNFFIRDYRMFQDLLTEKYGEPSAKNVTVINKQQITENDWAGHLSSRNIRLETKWSNSKTDISLTLSKTGDKPAIQIDYISKDISAIDLKEKRARIIKNL